MAYEGSGVATIGFIGLGDQGGPMARSIAHAGLELIVFDMRAKAMAEFAALGAKLATSVQQVAAEAGIVAFCVRDEKQASRLVFDGGGMLDTMRSGQLLVMHSTVSPGLALRMAAAAHERGIGFLDAPVSGSTTKAREQGKLAVFVGGSETDFEKGQPLLRAIGDQAELLGPVGSGEIGKICNNLMLFCNTFVSLEAVRLAGAYGISAETMVRMARHGSGRSWSLEEWGFWHRMIPQHPGGDSRDEIIEFLHKDLVLAMDAARAAGVDLPMGERAASISREVIGGIWDEVKRPGR